MLIVCTDHGFLLGEHGGWAKNWPPLYEEIAHTPFFVWDPRCPDAAGQTRSALVQPAIDLGPTLLRFFGQQPTDAMLGHDLAGVMRDEHSTVRDAAIFGYHGNRVNITDGRYVYLRTSRTPDNQPLNTYTLMSTAMRGFKCNLADVELAKPFDFTKGMKSLRIPAKGSLSQPVGGAVQRRLQHERAPEQEQIRPNQILCGCHQPRESGQTPKHFGERPRVLDLAQHRQPGLGSISGVRLPLKVAERRVSSSLQIRRPLVEAPDLPLTLLQLPYSQDIDYEVASVIEQRLLFPRIHPALPVWKSPSLGGEHSAFPLARQYLCTGTRIGSSQTEVVA